jgi:glycosyltransferase involved in cell wall biosynthesis
MGDLISVIIPVYNVEKYLRKCIDSVICQTYLNLEIILVDDGSPDLCPQICEEYAKRDKRIRVIHQKNGGLSAARNAGIHAANGEYIGFLDSDDYIAPSMYELLIDSIHRYDADVAVCNFEYVEEDGNIRYSASPVKNEILTKEQALKKLEEASWWYYVTAWNKLYHRSIFNEILFPVGKLHEDQFIVHEVFCQCKRIVTLEEKLYFYVQRENSIMSKVCNMRHLDDVEALYKRYLYYKKNNLEEFLPGVADVVSQLYCDYKVRVSVNTKSERKRTRKIDNMFREVYFSKKENRTFKNKLKFLLPDIYFSIKKLRIKSKYLTT